MTSPNAKMLGYAALALALVVIFLKRKQGTTGAGRRAIGATVLGGGIIMLAGPAPQIAAPLAGILVADVLLTPNVPGGSPNAVGLTNAVSHAITPADQFPQAISV